MSKVLLTSNGFFSETIEQQFIGLIDGELKELKATIITTASEQKENNRFAIKAKNELINMGIKMVEFCDVEHDNLELLKKSDIVYLNGGNPFYLLRHLQKSGADLVLRNLVKQNTVIVGVSAGAMVLGPNIGVGNHFTPDLNKIGLKEFTALNITDIEIFPHYDREDLFIDKSGKSIEDRLKKYECENKCSLIRLKDDDFVIININ